MEEDITIEEWILLYSQMPPEEQAGVEAYVKEHPEHEPLLDEAKALGTLLKRAGQLSGQPPDDEVLAYYASLQYLSSRPAPEWLKEPLARIQSAVEADPALRAKVEEYRSRIAILDQKSDAVAQFEQLTGHRLQPERSSPNRHGGQPLPMIRPMRRQPWLQWGVAAILALAVIYTLLLLVSRSAQTELDRLAAFSSDELEVSGYTFTTRGADPSLAPPSSDAAFLQALGQLQAAKSSFLGLFPSYDEAGLRKAQSLLQQVVADPEAGDFLRLEAYFFLGKTQLALQDVENGRRSLEEVVAGEGSKAAEAAAILEILPH